MRGVVLAAALLSSACWTGAEAPVAEPAPAPTAPAKPAIDLRVVLERTPCLGTCPSYVVTIFGDGRVQWDGDHYVVAVGRRYGHVTHGQLDELNKRIERARFFELNDYGELPAKPECTTTGSTTSCTFGASVSICTDTPHAIITVIRAGTSHQVDDDHCSERPELDALEHYIDRIANSETWIGQP